MNRNRFKFYQKCLKVFILLFMISGCSLSNQPLTNIVTAQLSSSPSPKPSDVAPAIPSTTLTSTPKVTPNKINTPSQTWTPLPPTPTLGPTLSGSDTEVLVLDLLHNNRGCELPCWWGFTPGKTRWAIARDFFLSYGIGFSDPTFLPYQENGIFSAYFSIEKYKFQVGSDFFTENGTIQLIKFYSNTYWPPNFVKFGDPFFMKAMSKFMLSEVLLSPPSPEQIFLQILPHKWNDLPDYYILIFYPDRGVLLEYDGQSEQYGNTLRLCPQKAWVDMWLWPSEDRLSMKDVFLHDAYGSEEDQLNFFERFRSWETVSGKSIDDFVTTFKAPNACFDTPAALWGRK
jgi:hypothetical protein